MANRPLASLTPHVQFERNFGTGPATIQGLGRLVKLKASCSVEPTTPVFGYTFFEDFCLKVEPPLGEGDTATFSLHRLPAGSSPVMVPPQPGKILHLLTANAGTLVAPWEIAKAINTGTRDYGDLIRQQIKILRKLLGQAGASPDLIENQHKQGYRFVGDAITFTGEKGEREWRARGFAPDKETKVGPQKVVELPNGKATRFERSPADAEGAPSGVPETPNQNSDPDPIKVIEDAWKVIEDAWKNRKTLRWYKLLAKLSLGTLTILLVFVLALMVELIHELQRFWKKWWKAFAVGMTTLMIAMFWFASRNRTSHPFVDGGVRQPFQSTLNPKDGLTYVWIPSGKFAMGCSSTDQNCTAQEQPAHVVTISNGFWLGQTEVTQAAFQKVMGFNHTDFKGDNLPAEATWYEAMEYCRAFGGRLPTEAEWEYAARAGSTGPGYGKMDEVAWHSLAKPTVSVQGQAHPHPVGRKLPNAWSLYDMLGNASEWVIDWYGAYGQDASSDPLGPPSGPGKVRRGGDCCGDLRLVSTLARSYTSPSAASGFRCAANEN